MPYNTHRAWLEAAQETVASYRRMIDAAVDQLSDEELHARPAEGFNSVAILLRHLGGNLRSRWTDFLTTDGEKPDRDRDREFQDWEGDRESLIAYFHAGWQALLGALQQLESCDLDQTVLIRGERHTIPQAIARSLTHLAYHAGQVTLIGRLVHSGEWRWLTIAPGGSGAHNQQTWGTPESRGVFGKE